MASEGLVGMPRANNGMKPAIAVALLAASGDATPSIAPFPNFSLFRETHFSRSYAMYAVSAGSIPGSRPRKNPVIVPRRLAQRPLVSSAPRGIMDNQEPNLPG